MSEKIIDTSNWPFVRYVMPEQVPESEAKQHIDALQGVIDRAEPYVLIFSGVEMPKNSKAFFQLYKKWTTDTREKQAELCRGAVRIEPDEKVRRAMWRRALRAISARAVPYPFKVVATDDEAMSQAKQWLDV